MTTPTLVLAGGFLGAGKTTLILRAAEQLRQQGLRVAIITNDQDEGLVDTRLSEARGITVREVAGACFCCRFADLIAAAADLTGYRPDIILAEPVGSCLDISATILQPLKAYHSADWRVAPYTVLVDPARAADIAGPAADPDVSFLFRNQIAEADILCLTKMDQHVDPPLLPVPIDFQLSALTGAGIREWLEEVLHGNRVAGAQVLDVDYDRYAEAEAALGWLNLHADLDMPQGASPAMVAGPLLDSLNQKLTAGDVRIAHLKVFDRAATGYIKASLCANNDEPEPEGDLMASPAARHELVINLRALGTPDLLREIVDSALKEIEGTVTVKHARAFRPGRPAPEHRMPVTAQR